MACVCMSVMCVAHVCGYMCVNMCLPCVDVCEYVCVCVCVDAKCVCCYVCGACVDTMYMCECVRACMLLCVARMCGYEYV